MTTERFVLPWTPWLVRRRWRRHNAVASKSCMCGRPATTIRPLPPAAFGAPVVQGACDIHRDAPLVNAVWYPHDGGYITEDETVALGLIEANP